MVRPVFKNGDKSNLNNQRPISLLPGPLYIYEKIRDSQLNNIVDNGNKDDNRFGLTMADFIQFSKIKTDS